MSSADSLRRLLEEGIDLGPSESIRFNKFDCLESRNDLDALLSILSRHSDSNGRQAVFTTLNLVANPDFEAIRQSDFRTYEYEIVPVTYKRYYPSEHVWPLWMEGTSKGLLCPQFHGREHLNVARWISALAAGDTSTRLAFQEGVWGFNNPGVSYQAAFDFVSPDELPNHARIIEDGLRLFESLLGYRAELFVPPNGLLSEKLYPVTASLGIRYVYASLRHYVPAGAGNYRVRYSFLGRKNAAGQRCITRNAFFEPSLEGRDWVASCLEDIDRAFRWRKPAIIGTHRVNFMGYLDESNRQRGLSQLDELLTKALRRWPDLEFMTTPELGKLMEKA